MQVHIPISEGQYPSGIKGTAGRVGQETCLVYAEQTTSTEACVKRSLFEHPLHCFAADKDTNKLLGTFDVWNFYVASRYQQRLRAHTRTDFSELDSVPKSLSTHRMACFRTATYRQHLSSVALFGTGKILVWKYVLQQKEVDPGLLLCVGHLRRL